MKLRNENKWENIQYRDLDKGMNKKTRKIGFFWSRHISYILVCPPEAADDVQRGGREPLWL